MHNLLKQRLDDGWTLTFSQDTVWENWWFAILRAPGGGYAETGSGCTEEAATENLCERLAAAASSGVFEAILDELLATGHQVTLMKEPDGFGAEVIREADNQRWDSTMEDTPARALWAASPLHGDDEPFPGWPAPAGRHVEITVTGDCGHVLGTWTDTVAEKYPFYCGECGETKNLHKYPWTLATRITGGELPEPGIADDVRTLSAEMTDVQERLELVENALHSISLLPKTEAAEPAKA